jgi:hypothetical protein
MSLARWKPSFSSVSKSACSAAGQRGSAKTRHRPGGLRWRSPVRSPQPHPIKTFRSSLTRMSYSTVRDPMWWLGNRIASQPTLPDQCPGIRPVATLCPAHADTPAGQREPTGMQRSPRRRQSRSPRPRNDPSNPQLGMTNERSLSVSTPYGSSPRERRTTALSEIHRPPQGPATVWRHWAHSSGGGSAKGRGL